MQDKNYVIDEVHISQISVGDTVEHEGKITTVCAKDIRRDRFMGLTLFGDSYRLGYKPVKRVKFLKPN